VCSDEASAPAIRISVSPVTSLSSGTTGDNAAVALPLLRKQPFAAVEAGLVEELGDFVS